MIRPAQSVTARKTVRCTEAACVSERTRVRRNNSLARTAEKVFCEQVPEPAGCASSSGRALGRRQRKDCAEARRGTHRDSSCASALPRPVRWDMKPQPRCDGSGESTGFISATIRRRRRREAHGTSSRRGAATPCARSCGTRPAWNRPGQGRRDGSGWGGRQRLAPAYEREGGGGAHTGRRKQCRAQLRLARSS